MNAKHPVHGELHVSKRQAVQVAVVPRRFLPSEPREHFGVGQFGAQTVANPAHPCI